MKQFQIKSFLVSAEGWPLLLSLTLGPIETVQVGAVHDGREDFYNLRNLVDHDGIGDVDWKKVSPTLKPDQPPSKDQRVPRDFPDYWVAQKGHAGF